MGAKQSSLAASAGVPTVHYWPIRGRAETFRISLALAGVPWKEEAPVDFKTDLEHFHFAQAPRYSDSTVDICQSNAILRHIGRTYGLYPADPVAAAHVDELMDGIEALTLKYLGLVYEKSLADDAKAAYWATHLDPASKHERCGGAHFAYLAAILRRNAGGAGFAVGDKPTVADVALFTIVELHVRAFGQDKIKAEYPELVGHYERFAALPGVKEYLAGDKRPAKVNGNGLG